MANTRAPFAPFGSQRLAMPPRPWRSSPKPSWACPWSRSDDAKSACLVRLPFFNPKVSLNDVSRVENFVDSPEIWAALNMADCPLEIGVAVEVADCVSGPTRIGPDGTTLSSLLEKPLLARDGESEGDLLRVLASRPPTARLISNDCPVRTADTCPETACDPLRRDAGNPNGVNGMPTTSGDIPEGMFVFPLRRLNR